MYTTFKMGFPILNTYLEAPVFRLLLECAMARMENGLRDGKQGLDIEIYLIKLIHQSNMVYTREIPPVRQLISVIQLGREVERGGTVASKW